MKKILSKLKKVNKQISEAEVEIQNIKDAPDTFYKSGEKNHELSKLNHWIGELKESKAKILVNLVEAANTEIKTLDHAAAA